MKDKESQSFQPYVPAAQNPAELTVRSVIVGVLLLLVFGTANAYLGLKIGMTVSASIPAAVASMAIMRGLMKNATILENNMAQTIASAGEALAAGVVFSLPAMYMLGEENYPSLLLISLVALFGGVIGVAAMVIYRRYLIVKQHNELAYPEGTACAEILIAGEEGGVSAKTVFTGGVLAAVYRLLQGTFGFFPEALGWSLPGLPGAQVGLNALPSMLGVGYLVGTRIAGVMLAGGVVAALVITPLITIMGAQSGTPIFPALATVAELGPDGIWSDYIQYIGAGALTIGGIFEFVKAMPAVKAAVTSVFGAMGDKREGSIPRTDRDLSMKVLLVLFAVVILMIAILPSFPVGLLGAVLVAVFGFLFVSIASRIVGVVGSSSNPISGMTIATIFASALIFRAMGYEGSKGMVAAVVVGAVVTCATAIAGDTSQDLKTGYLVGATPRCQQVGELLGVLIFAGISGVVLSLLHSAYTIGSEAMPSPATAVISVLVEGIFSGNLPWGLLLIGAALGLMAELLGVPALPFAIGIYLPISLSVPIFVGGLVRAALVKKGHDNDSGVLYASGLVAGDAIVGVIGAGLAVGGISLGFGAGLLPEGIANAVCLAAFALMAVSIYTTTKKNKSN